VIAVNNRPRIIWWLLCLIAAQLASASGCARYRLPAIDPYGESIFLSETESTTFDSPVFDYDDEYAGGGLFGSLPILPEPGECAAPQEYGWTPHPLLTQPLGVAQTQPATPAPLIAPPQPLLPYGYASAYDQNALSSSGGDPRTGHNARLAVNPRRLVAPVGRTVVLQAGICDSDGYFIKDQPIEWSISPDSVGTIVEVDRTDESLTDRWLHRPPTKKSGTYAIGRTSLGPQVLPRGNSNPQDDISLRSGETWVSLSSAAEGSTHITAVAPTVLGWNERQQTATIHWVDGQWQFPAPAVSNYGGGHTLTTRVSRATDGAPVEGWIVRYEIAGGTPAAFDMNGAQTIDVPTSSFGEASVTVIPQGEFSGVTQVNMQVVRRGRTPGDLPRLPVGQGSTSITWTSSGQPIVPITPGIPPTAPPPAAPPPTAPVLSARVTGVSVAEVGANATYQFRVENMGNDAADSLQIVSETPTGLNYMESSPQGAIFGNSVRWDLGSLEPGMARSVTVTYRVERDGQYQLCATASATSANDATDCVTTNVRTSQPQLDIQLQGDNSARVGEQIHYDLYISNLSDQPLTNVRLDAEFDEGLEHRVATSPMEWVLGAIGPRETRTLPLNFIVRSAGRRCFNVTVSDVSGASDRAEMCVEVQPDAASAAPPQPRPQDSELDLPPISPPASTSPDIDLRGRERPGQFAPADSGAGLGQEDLGLRIRRLGADVDDPNLLVYVVEITNTGELTDENVRLQVQTPSGTRFQSSVDPPLVRPIRRGADGRQVDYAPIATLRPSEMVSFQIKVSQVAGERLGDFLARVVSDRHPDPIVADDRIQ
jgi:hypothetical protein